MDKVRIEKDDWFGKNKWFIVNVEFGHKFPWNAVGFKTKKEALAMVEAVGCELVT